MSSEGFLIKQEKYLEAGIHIGTKLRVIDMTRFIYRTRSDGLYVLDLRKIDERIRMAGKLLSKFDPEGIVVVASRAYSSQAAKRFAQITGSQVFEGRFIPGIFTNVSRDDFAEPKLVIVCDPKGERQAVVECGKMGIPTVGLCDTDNFTMFIDWVIPCNNKGRRSLALIFWLLAREMAMNSGKISSYDEFQPTLEEFEAQASQPVLPPAEPAPAVDAASADEAEGEEEPEEEESEDEPDAKAPAAEPKAHAPKKEEGAAAKPAPAAGAEKKPAARKPAVKKEEGAAAKPAAHSEKKPAAKKAEKKEEPKE